MHKCDICKETAHLYVGRENKYYCGDCFVKDYKVKKGIKSKLRLIKK